MGKKPSIAGRLGVKTRELGKKIPQKHLLGALLLGAFLLGALVTPVLAQVENPRPFAAPSTVTSAAPSGVASLGQVTLALALVLAVIFVAAWLMRRVRGFGR